MSRVFALLRLSGSERSVGRSLSSFMAAFGSLPPFERLVYAVVGVWILVMISLPIVRWTLGETAMPAGISVNVIIQIVAVLITLAHGQGARRALLVAALVVPAAWLVEYVGSTTGVPFGAYHYTDRLHPQIGGVPVLIPFAWLMMLPPAWALAYRIAGARKAAFVAVSALAFTAWDLFLDPQMVGWGLWTWHDVGAFHFFGIPCSNYGGWLLASALLTALMLPFLRIDRLPQRPLLIIYAITWLFEAIGQLFFWGLPGPALVGFLGMGAMLGWALRAKAI